MSDADSAEIYLALREVSAALAAVTDSFDDRGNFGTGPEGNWLAFNLAKLAQGRAIQAIALVEGKST